MTGPLNCEQEPLEHFTFYYPGVPAAGVPGRERVLLSQLDHWGPRLESPGRGPGRHGQEGAGGQTLPQLRAPPREAQKEDHLQEGSRQHRQGEGVQKVIQRLKSPPVMIRFRFRRRRFLSDIFNTMLDVKWRYVHMAFFVSFIGSWLFFALIW